MRTKAPKRPQPGRVSEPEREYCLGCESWEWADTHAHFTQSADPGARALTETDLDDHG
jgi:hypothetical protein